MREMKNPKIKAAMWVAACALYMMCGEVLRQWDIRLGAVFALLLGMFCAAECFSCGREYELDQRRGIEGTGDDWAAAEHGMKPVRCRICGCPEFYRAAGRMICVCCGSVLDEDGDRDGTE